MDCLALFSCAYKTTPTVKEQDIAKNMLRFYGQIVLVYLAYNPTLIAKEQTIA